MTTWILVLTTFCLLVLIPTAYAGYIGAPYVPVRRAALKKAFDKLNIGPRDVVVDLGAGDGGVLLEATRRGARALGYELSPIMWAIAKVRLLLNDAKNPPPLRGPSLIREGTSPDKGRSSRQNGTGGVYLRNFYTQTLPPDTTIIFVFLMPQNMERLFKYLKTQNLPNIKYLASYTFPIPNMPPLDIVEEKSHGRVYIYNWPV